MDRRLILYGAALAAVSPLLLIRSLSLGRDLPQDGEAWFTNADVFAHDGRMFRFYDDLLKGKIVLINFFFALCGDICPTVVQNLSNVKDLLGGRLGKDIFMYSISLQPELDTPELLASYARAYGAGSGWLLLTGKPYDIEVLRHRLGFVDSDPRVDADLTQHLGAIRIGNEAMHRWTMASALASPTAIVQAVKRVIPEPA